MNYSTNIIQQRKLVQGQPLYISFIQLLKKAFIHPKNEETSKKRIRWQFPLMMGC